ncbi:MAG: hypothetical protein WAW54_07400 [Parvibaculum sedimenti]|nr:hypothetical protein [Parvibaculum sedimenti]
MIEKERLQLRDGRPLDFEVGISPMFKGGTFWRPRFSDWIALIGGAEIDSAHYPDGAIGNQYFAMVAIIERVAHLRVQRINRIERDEVHTGFLQPIEECRGCAAGSEAVIDYIDGNPSLTLGDEEIAEMLSVTFDIFENVIFEVYIIGGAFDRAKHGAERRGPIAQESGAVTGNQGALSHRLLDRKMAPEYASVARLSAYSTKQRLALLRAEWSAGSHDLLLRRRGTSMANVGH